MIRSIAWLAAAAMLLPQPAASPPVRGLSNVPAVARVYDAILDADFDGVAPGFASGCTLPPPGVLPAPDPTISSGACQVLDAVARWWEISLDPASRTLDQRFTQSVERAIETTDAWTRREPLRAEAWFYRGGAYGARAQFRVLRQQRLAAARDGARIKESLDRALALDPALDDARFGIGMYQYYADVAPAAIRMLRWLLLLPGGDRTRGLELMQDARARGQLLRSEADYQLHLVYLWYEKRFDEALAIVRTLAARHRRNPLFPQIEAEILDGYFHDAHGARALLQQVIARAGQGDLHAPSIAIARARALQQAIDARAKR